MQNVRLYLEQAGWYENRNIDISCMISEYEQLGFRIPNNFIQSFLMEYGNLRIEFRNDNESYSDIRINPDAGFQFIDSEYLAVLEKIVADNLLPIGSIHSDHLGLLVSFKGKFYLLGDDGIYHLGDDFLNVCETVFLQKPLIKIGGPN
ncbi:MAG: immunity protein [Fluviicola sp.]|jgi:hypothetical protein|uniref:SUKH-3 domain-containing protein n=1 Tax=Fluviicola sp. TaxID=1917219 RepID=UPI002639F63F|nr:SUKH-3 domain-containing protein [Fluviicola sp.]MDF3027594.1 immunity protein [Fluviicola sp.]